MNKVTSLILKKKELSNIDSKIAEKVINSYINKKIQTLINAKRFKTKEFKKFMKVVRAHLRRQYGAFQNPKIDRKKLIKNKDYIGLLKSHQSSKERLNYYKKFYVDLFKITKKPESIIDFGCGMNPISFEYMGLNKLEYFALDISNYDLEIIQTYFDQKKIKGKTLVFDAIHDDYDFKKFDVCFMFKLFEILETTRSHRLTEQIFKKLKAKWIIASFSTKTLSGAPMTKRRRVWFEIMLKRLGHKFKIIQIPNEIFYVIKK